MFCDSAATGVGLTVSGSNSKYSQILEFPGITDTADLVDLAFLCSPRDGEPARSAFILEDIESNALILAGYLEQLGFDQVVWVKSIETCYRMMPHLRAARFDLVLFDIMLSDGVAFDLMRELATRDRAYKVCAFTGRNRPDELTQLREAGCDWVLKKPIDLDTVRNGLEGMGFDTPETEADA